MLKESCIDAFDAISCRGADSFCVNEILVPFMSSGMSENPSFGARCGAYLTLATGRNPYDISKKCDGEYSETLCYPATKYNSIFTYEFLFGPDRSTARHIDEYLDRPDVREMLGVDPSLTANFSSCNMDIILAFKAEMDEFGPTPNYVAALLERGVRTLVYVGKNDWACSHVGNEAWTLQLEWSGHEAFSKQPLRPWNVRSLQAGMTRSAQGLTFATIDGAGHMVR